MTGLLDFMYFSFYFDGEVLRVSFANFSFTELVNLVVFTHRFLGVLLCSCVWVRVCAA